MDTRSRWSAALLFAALVVSGCSGGDSGDAREPDRPAKATTTTLTTEQEVEAAFRKYLAVGEEAYRKLDTTRLGEVTAGGHLEGMGGDIEGLKAKGTPVVTRMEHNYRVIPGGLPGQVMLRDDVVNHSVLVDLSGMALEPDPNERLIEIFTFERKDGIWKVVFVKRSQPDSQ